MNINDFIEKFKLELDSDDVEVNPETEFVNAEFWDSLTNMAVTSMIGDSYDLHLDFDELNNFSTIQELFDFVSSKQL